LGVLAAIWLARPLRSLLYDVEPADPVTLGGVSLLLIFAALAATYIPARRATQVNPIESLLSE
jgi:putative ABC transport system permease protein